MTQRRLDFEIDLRIEPNLMTEHAGVAMLIEAYRQSGAAAVIERAVTIKSRRRGLTPNEMVESFLALWAAGGERTEDFDRFRQDAALARLVGHDFPAAQTARDFLATFHDEDAPLLQAGLGSVPGESAPLQGVAAANRELILDLQSRRPARTATLDVDATLIPSTKRAAKKAYDGRCGYQPVLALWAEQDVILADEFRDGNVTAASGNLRVIEKAVTALPPGIETILLRADSALYDNRVMSWLEDKHIGYAISADMSRELMACILALPDSAWHGDGHEHERIVREWAEVAYVPETPLNLKKSEAPHRRYLAIRIRPRQANLIDPKAGLRHFAVVTNRPDPAGGSGLDLIDWHRIKAGSIEHVHDVIRNELAANALPSQKFGANAAWLRLNVLLYNLLSAFKRVGLPEEFHAIRPKRLRFILLNTVAKVVRHARETVLRFANQAARQLADRLRTVFAVPRAALSGV